MPYYRKVGEVPRKRHVQFRLDGRYHPEELMGEEGFSSSSSLLYHRHSPSAVLAIDPVDDLTPELVPNRPLRPYHLRTPDLPTSPGADLVSGRTVLLGNDDVRLCYASASATSPLFRDATGDELVYVHHGAAVLESVFGALAVEAGDYVVVPTGTTHRWVVPDGGAVEALVLEARSHVGLPAKYRAQTGQLLEGAPFSERDLRAPAEPLLVEGEEVAVLVRTRQGLSCHIHATHPFDVVGWDGYLYPYALSIRDFEPIVGRIHQPPPVHQTFAGPGFVVCSFVPRPFDFDPDAVKIPYHHANVDSDEVLFYADGNFMSRAGSGIGIGSISLHPAGFIHGPQPGSLERSMDQTHTSEVAVMVDTFRPLLLGPAALAVSDEAYPWTWSRQPT
jgi:homogentisate 1,2-dioxygenase